MELTEIYQKETGNYWLNIDDEPDLKYVMWLENRYIDLAILFKKAERRWRIFDLFFWDAYEEKKNEILHSRFKKLCWKLHAFLEKR
jgi:hypothetical protein